MCFFLFFLITENSVAGSHRVAQHPPAVVAPTKSTGSCHCDGTADHRPRKSAHDLPGGGKHRPNEPPSRFEGSYLRANRRSALSAGSSNYSTHSGPLSLCLSAVRLLLFHVFYLSSLKELLPFVNNV